MVASSTASSDTNRVMVDDTRFRRVQTQFIAAAIDPVHGDGMQASSGAGTGDWGIWHVDPGPRGVQLREYDRLESTGGVAPRGWKFDKVHEPSRTQSTPAVSTSSLALHSRTGGWRSTG